MKIEMNDAGCIDLVNIEVEQIALLVQALQASPNQAFMENSELKKMFKLLLILQSEVFQNQDSGKIDFRQLRSSPDIS